RKGRPSRLHHGATIHVLEERKGQAGVWPGQGQEQVRQAPDQKGSGMAAPQGTDHAPLRFACVLILEPWELACKRTTQTRTMLKYLHSTGATRLRRRSQNP